MNLRIMKNKNKYLSDSSAIHIFEFEKEKSTSDKKKSVEYAFYYIFVFFLNNNIVTTAREKDCIKFSLFVYLIRKIRVPEILSNDFPRLSGILQKI